MVLVDTMVVLVIDTISPETSIKARCLTILTNRAGHTIDKCYKLHGFPPKDGWKNKKVAAVVHIDEEAPVNDSHDLNSPSQLLNTMR